MKGWRRQSYLDIQPKLKLFVFDVCFMLYFVHSKNICLFNYHFYLFISFIYYYFFASLKGVGDDTQK